MPGSSWYFTATLSMFSNALVISASRSNFSSALSFGILNVPATAKNAYSIVRDNKKASSTNQAFQDEEHPIVEQIPKVEQEIKPEVEKAKSVAEEAPHAEKTEIQKRIKPFHSYCFMLHPPLTSNLIFLKF